MREALRGLTVRGRSLLAGGLAGAAASLLFGLRDLMPVAVLLVALPVLAAWSVASTRYRLGCDRQLEPARVPAEATGHVRLDVENLSRLPTGTLLVADTVPPALGVSPRSLLAGVPAHGHRRLRYPVHSMGRGRYLIGPVTVRAGDPFGLCEVVRSFTARDTLVVTPTIESLPPLPASGAWGGRGESRARAVATAGEDDVATRQWRHGDDLRRVHWRATARVGELMVRTEEQPWQARAAVLLDNRAVAHRGYGPTASFEWAVSAAASIALDLLGQGYHVSLVTGTGQPVTPPGSLHGTNGRWADPTALLDAMAEVTTTSSSVLTPATAALRRAGTDSLLVAVAGSMTASQVAELAPLRHGGTRAVALLLDVDSWGQAGTGRPLGAPVDVGAAAAVLMAAGWHTVVARSGDRLRSVWASAAGAPAPDPAVGP